MSRSRASGSFAALAAVTKSRDNFAERSDQPKTQLNCRSEDSLQGFSHSSESLLSSKNRIKLSACHGEGHSLLSDFGVEALVLKFKAEMIMEDHTDCLNTPEKYAAVTAKQLLQWPMILISVFYVCVKGLF